MVELLGYLAGIRPFPAVVDRLDYDQLAYWLIENDLASLAQVRFKESCPDLAARLQADLFSTAATNALHWHHLKEIDAHFASRNTPAVLLKGAALAETVYDGPEQRSMADVDLWLEKQHIAGACGLMEDLDFHNLENAARPLELQALANGEIQYVNNEQPPTLVELHLSPFSGWWLKRTAAINLQDIWARQEPLQDWRSFSQLAAEDAVIHMAVHLAVNHQFGLSPLRSVLDILLTDQVRRVDWLLAAGRAREWRVATAVWLALVITQQLTGTAGLKTALHELQPSDWRRRRLQDFVSADSILAGKDIRDEKERYLYLLLLVDRPRDAGKLMVRTLWPESEWLDARYGGSVDHWKHIRRLVAQRGL